MSAIWSTFDDLVMLYPEGSTIDPPSLDLLASAATDSYQKYSGLVFASEPAWRDSGDSTEMGFGNWIYSRSIENGQVWVGTVEGHFFAEETYLRAGGVSVVFDVETGRRISKGTENLNCYYYQFATGWSGPEWSVDEFDHWAGFTYEDAMKYV